MAGRPIFRADFLIMSRVDLGALQGVLLYSGKVSADSRGSFIKFFEKNPCKSRGFDPDINSLAISSNVEQGTIRGLHFQSPPYEEEKLISCFQGNIFEVIVDLRRDSPTVGKWAGIEVGDAEPVTLCLPKGIAHGYQTLTPGVKMLYGLSSEFNQEHSYSLNYADDNLNIIWPLPVKEISEKDSRGVTLGVALDLASTNSSS